MFNFLCTQNYLKNHFVLKVNKSKPSIKNYLVFGCEYSRRFQRFCQRKHVGEVLGNVLWGSSKSDGHIISPHNYSNVFENYQLGILSWYNTKFSKLESKNTLGSEYGVLICPAWDWNSSIYSSKGLDKTSRYHCLSIKRFVSVPMHATDLNFKLESTRTLSNKCTKT